MKRDKALLPFGGFKTLSEFQISKNTPFFESLYVSCKFKDKFDFKASFIEDTKEFNEYSPLVALYSILKKFDTHVFVVSVDTPFVTYEVFEKLYKNINENEAIIAKSPYGTHQLCAIYSPSILETLKKQLKQNEHKIKNTLAKIKTIYVDFNEDKPFTNLNHLEDYDRAKEML